LSEVISLFAGRLDFGGRRIFHATKTGRVRHPALKFIQTELPETAGCSIWSTVIPARSPGGRQKGIFLKFLLA
jgi:hypothetical protein